MVGATGLWLGPRGSKPAPDSVIVPSPVEDSLSRRRTVDNATSHCRDERVHGICQKFGHDSFGGTRRAGTTDLLSLAEPTDERVDGDVVIGPLDHADWATSRLGNGLDLAGQTGSGVSSFEGAPLTVG